MATARQALYTVEAFRDMISRSEYADRLFELIDGEMIEVSLGRTKNSGLGHLVTVAVHIFCHQHHLPCYTSGGDGAYAIQGNVVAPDFAYKTTAMSDKYPDSEPPLWAVEIISPTDKAPDIRRKRQIYTQAGILYWEVYPEARSIDVYAPGHPMQTANIGDTLESGDVLPGFQLAVKDLFET